LEIYFTCTFKSHLSIMGCGEEADLIHTCLRECSNITQIY
jgi:hypothetical protein